MESDSDRLRELELSNVRTEEKLSGIKHDVSNVRQMLNGMKGLQDARHQQIEADIKAIGKSLVSVGLSVVSAAFMLIISMLAYFIIERMNMTMEAHDATTKMGASK